MDTSAPLSGPSAGSWALAGAILGATAMWFGMSGVYLKSKTKGGKKSKQTASWPNSYDVKIHPDSSDDELMKRLAHDPDSKVAESDDASEYEDEGIEGELSTFPSHPNEECKLVLVVRTDLGMGKGKIAAQCSHATLACYKHLVMKGGSSHPVLKRWERLGQAKIAVQCPGGEDEMLTLQAQAVSLGLAARVIHDAGRTQIASGTATVLGVGPGPKSVVDLVTKGLKLL